MLCGQYSNMLCIDNWTMTFVITLFVRVVSEIKVILWLEKPHKFIPFYTNYEAYVGLWDTSTRL